MTPLPDVSLKDIPNILHSLSTAEQERLLLELEKLSELRTKSLAQRKFLAFVKEMWPNFIGGRHHARIAEAFERIAEGKCKRLILCMPPRHTKSEFGSYLLPAWFLGRFPGKKVIQCSNTAELAVGFGRKVRNLVDTEAYHTIFPDLELRADSKAAGRWNTSAGGDYFAIGVEGTVTGKGADLLVIDDPHSEQQAKLAESQPEIYDKVYEWYTSGPRQRLQPNAAIVIIQCMTGDTGVLMPDGSERPLRDIRPGDYVATYDDGVLTTARVNNWKRSGVDRIYTVQTQSGRVLRANERHPFLVEANGVREWKRLKHLRPGMSLVSLRGVSEPHVSGPTVVSAPPAWRGKPITGSTLTPPIGRSGTTANGRGKAVPAAHPWLHGECALNAITPSTPPHHRHPSSGATSTSSIGTGLLSRTITAWLRSRAGNAQYAVSLPAELTHAPTGGESYVSTTAMTLEKCEGSSATTAISPSDMQRQSLSLWPSSAISAFTTDMITQILPDGVEDVFDVEIERTENFIANGVVSHNTRWSKRDLVGQVIKAAAQRGGEEWEVIEFPAILPSGNPLWPEFWPLKELEALKEELPLSKWMAQYQQDPSSEQSAIVKREWWQQWEKDTPPDCEFILQSWDTAFEKTQRSDYSACTTWGVFYREDEKTGTKQANIILLNAFRAKMEFPQLKQAALDEYKEWEPDGVIIEKKASGAPLIYEMRAMGIPVQEFVPTKGNDKISRLNAVADIFASGRVWAPNVSWAEEVIEEVASFPSGAHDDYVDSTSMALHRFRKGGYITTTLDEPEAPRYFKSPRRSQGYY